MKNIAFIENLDKYLKSRTHWQLQHKLKDKILNYILIRLASDISY